jgi:Xaa-Pro aminopeptidase
MDDRHLGRIEALRSSLRNEKDPADAVLVSAVANVTYLTGFLGDSSTLLVLPGRLMAITDGRYTEQFARECPGLEVHVRPVGQPMMAGVVEVAGKLGIASLAFEKNVVTVAGFEQVKEKAPTIELRGVSGWVETLRRVKDAGEIAEIRTSIEIAERAFERFRAEVEPGKSEKELADRLDAILRACGATGPAFPPIVAAGRNAALPHYQPSGEVVLGEDDILLVDWGATGHPYKSDLTRVLTTGKVAPEFQAVYQSVLSAQERAIAAIRPGVSAKAVDAEAREAIAEAGFGDFFNHGLGHGFGIEIHERPFLGREPDETLEAGMVVTIEPGIYLPDRFGVRIEDDVLVTGSGAERLSRLRADLGSASIA